jgi:hypothetical protein
MAEKGKKKGHLCPRIPDYYGAKFTGPAWNGEDFGKARSLWFEFLRTQKNVGKMPRITKGD